MYTCTLTQITVLGGGYIALEFAGIFHRFGGEVHVAFRGDKPLRGFDEEVHAPPCLLAYAYLL